MEGSVQFAVSAARERPTLDEVTAPAMPAQHVPTDIVGRRVAERRRRSLSFQLGRIDIGPMLLGLDIIAYATAVVITGTWAVAYGVLLLLLLALYTNAGLYRARLAASVLDDLPAMIGRALVASALTTTIGIIEDGQVGLALVETAILFALVSVGLRTVGYVAAQAARRRGHFSSRTLIVGAGQVGGQLAQTLLDHSSYGLRPVGFLDNEPYLSPQDRPVPVLGKDADITRIIVEEDIRHVVVAFGSTRESSVVDVLRACDRLSCEISFVPRLYELQALSRDMEMVWGIPLVRLRRAPYRTLSWRVKRLFDVVVAAAALVPLLPVMAIIALLVRTETGPGVLFKQERVGLDGHSFMLLKFRSLRPVHPKDSAERWSIVGDANLGTVGRWLRRTSLDELPQLLNILRGDMSLVGPRPERPYFVKEFTERFPRYMARHRVPAGLTGWAQIHGLRGDTSIGDRARFDNCYVENWSLWGDVKIMLRTAGQVLRGR